MVRDFAVNEIAPVAGELDQTFRVPLGERQEDGRAGAARGPLGRGARRRRDGPRSATSSPSTSWPRWTRPTPSPSPRTPRSAPRPSSRSAREEQKERFVPLLASGRVLGGFGLTEPAAGSDAGGTQTTARHEWTAGTSSTAARSSSPTPAWARSSWSRRSPTASRGRRGSPPSSSPSRPTDLERRPRARRRPRGRARPSSRGSGRARRRTRWAGAPPTRASSCWRTRSSPTTTCWASRGAASSTSCRRWTPAASASARFRWASRRAHSSRRCATPTSAGSSGSRSTSSRASSSCWPTWRRRSRPRGTWSTTPPGSSRTGRPYSREAAMAKLFASELAMRATTQAPCRSMAATDTPRNTRSSA